VILLLLLAIISLPILEISVLIRVGSFLGPLNTFGLLILITFIGSGILKSAGRRTLFRLQEAVARGEPPANEVIEGVLIFLSGILFVIPGFVTDVVGIFLLFPLTRKIIAAGLKFYLLRQIQKGRMRFYTFGSRPTSARWSEPESRYSSGRIRDVVDIEAEEVSKPELPPSKPDGGL
jgi:UPF0716 protein FxsA